MVIHPPCGYHVPPYFFGNMKTACREGRVEGGALYSEIRMYTYTKPGQKFLQDEADLDLSFTLSRFLA